MKGVDNKFLKAHHDLPSKKIFATLSIRFYISRIKMMFTETDVKTEIKKSFKRKMYVIMKMQLGLVIRFHDVSLCC